MTWFDNPYDIYEKTGGDEPKEVFNCAYCHEGVYVGETAYKIGNKVYCMDCVEEFETVEGD